MLNDSGERTRSSATSPAGPLVIETNGAVVEPGDRLGHRAHGTVELDGEVGERAEPEDERMHRADDVDRAFGEESRQPRTGGGPRDAGCRGQRALAGTAVDAQRGDQPAVDLVHVPPIARWRHPAFTRTAGKSGRAYRRLTDVISDHSRRQ